MHDVHELSHDDDSAEASPARVAKARSNARLESDASRIALITALRAAAGVNNDAVLAGALDLVLESQGMPRARRRAIVQVLTSYR